jgi:hypothetical protein
VYRNYKDIIDNHPLLRGRIKDEKDYYLPCYRLALRIEKKVKEEINRYIKNNDKNKLPTDLREYIPLEKTRRVDNNVTNYLRELIKMVLSEKGKEVWTLSTDSTNKLIQRFWYQVRNYYYPGDKKSSGSSGLNFLDILCEFVGESGFLGFIEKEFREKVVIRILTLPFWRQDDSIGKNMEEKLAYPFKKMKTDYNEPITILPHNSGSATGILTKEEAREIALNNSADVVFWCFIYEENKMVLNGLIVDPVIGYYQDYWKMEFDKADFTNSPTSVQNKLEATIYWCLAIQFYLKNDFKLCLKYLKKVLKLNVDSEEVIFRMGAIGDMIDQHENSLSWYLTLLERVGIPDAGKWKQDLFGRSKNNSDSQRKALFDELKRDFIKKTDIKRGTPEEDGIKKLIYFEIIRIELALDYRSRLPEIVVERALGKAIRFAKRKYMEPNYHSILGKAFYEMALIHHDKMVSGSGLDLRDILYYYENAALFSNDKSIHEGCIDFFKKSGYLQEVSKKVRENFPNNQMLHAMYEQI